jgi:hypothetical protein
MVQLLRREPVMAYELRDASGRAIGQVIQPQGAPRTGRGAETVLLIRKVGPVALAEVPSAA